MRTIIKRITIVFFLLSLYGSSPDAEMAPRHDTPGHLAGRSPLPMLLKQQRNEALCAVHVFNIRLADGMDERPLLNALPGRDGPGARL